MLESEKTSLEQNIIRKDGAGIETLQMILKEQNSLPLASRGLNTSQQGNFLPANN